VTLRPLLISALAAFVLSNAASADSDPISTAQHAIQMLDDAATSLSEVESAADRVAALTKTVRAYEAGLSTLRESLRHATLRERTILQSFEAKQDQLSRLLGALQTIQNTPKPLLLMHPSGALGTARSGMILSDVAPALRSQAEALNAQLKEVSQLRQLQERAVDSLKQGLSGAQTARSDLSKAMADRTDLPRGFTSDPEKLETLLNASKTLSEFADSLGSLGETQISAPADFRSAKGGLDLPASSHSHDHTATDAGLTLSTPPHALVTSPWPATLRYQGPLLDHGNVVILEPEAGYLLILAGLEISFGKVGEIVTQGAPIGLMGGLPPNPNAFLITKNEGGGGPRQESLYIELRENGAPVDPSEWFAALKE